MAHENVLDLVLLKNRVIDRQYGAAGIAENDIHALRLESPEQRFRPGIHQLR